MFNNLQKDNPKFEYIPLSEAGQILNTSRDYMNVLVRRGKLRAVKLGRNWVTTREWVAEYRNGLNISKFKDLNISEIVAAEKEEFRNLKRGLVLEREKALESKALTTLLLTPEIKLSSRELKVEERKNILELVSNRFKKVDASEFEKASRRLGILRSLRQRSGLRFIVASGLAIVLLTMTVGLAGFNISTFQNLNISKFRDSNISKYQANILSDVFKNFPSDIPLFYRWLADGAIRSLAFLKLKTPSELALGELPEGKSKIIKPQEAPPRVDTLDEALALDALGPEEVAPQLAEGEAVGAVSTSQFTLIENRLSTVEANLKEQKAITNSELSLQKKTILGTLETLIGISKLLPTYPISTIVVQGQPATLTTYSVQPQVNTGFDRLSADYFTLAHDATINGHLTVRSGGEFNTLSVSGATTLTGNATIGGTLNVAGDTTLANVTINGVFTAPKVSLTNASTTYLTVSNTSWIKELFATQNLSVATTTANSALTVQGNTFLYGGLGVGIATTTNGAIQTTGDVFVGRNLRVAGNSTTIGGSSSDTLTVNSSVNSSFVPNQNNFYNLGSPAFYWGNLYVDTVNANNISGASTTISGTKSNDFTINTDNASVDQESMNLIFFRGTVPPNAVITWNAATSSKRFEFNQAARFFNESASTTNPVLTVQGNTGLTANAFQVLDVATTTVLFSVNPVSQKTTMINASTTNLTVSGNLWAGSSGAFMLADGTVSNPALAFASDIDTGLFRIGDGKMSFATNATTSLTIDTGKVIVGNDIFTASYQLEVADRDANSNTIVDELRLSHFTTGTAANGLGTGLLFYGQDSTGAGQNLARVAAQVEQANPSNGFASNLSFWTVGGGGLLEKMRLTSAGGLALATTTIPSGYGMNIATSTNIFGKLTVGTGTIDILSGNIISNSGQFNITNSANTALTFSTNNTERMRIDSTGNVGIGTTTPEAFLNIYTNSGFEAANPHFSLSGTGGKKLKMGYDSPANFGWIQATETAVAHRNLVLNPSGGNVGIASTSPSAVLSVNVSNATGVANALNITSATSSLLYVRSDGNVGIGTTSPAAQLHVAKADSSNLTDVLVNPGVKTSGSLLSLQVGGSNRFNVNQGGAVETSGSVTIPFVSVFKDSLNSNFYEPSDGFGTSFLANNTGGGNGNIQFQTLGASLLTRMVITNSGQVGISSNISPVNALSVQGALSVGDLSYYGATAPTNGAIIQGNVGIGTTTPSGKLHVYKGYSGVTPNTTLDAIVIEKNANVGMSIVTPNTSTGYYGFGDPEDAAVAYLSYDHSTNKMTFFGNANDRMVIDSSGNVGIGTTSPGFKFDANDTNSALQLLTYGTRITRAVTGVAGPSLEIFKARGSVASPTVISSGDDLLALDVRGYVGSTNTYVQAAKIAVTTTGTISDSGVGSIGGIISFHTRADGAGASSERLRITDTGNVGIGTTTPTALLNLQGIESTGQLMITNPTASTGRSWRVISNNIGHLILRDDTAGTNPLRIEGAAPSNSIYITSSGLVGIGTSTGLWAKTTIDGGGSTSATAALSIINNASTSLLFVRNDGNVGIGMTSPNIDSSGGTILTISGGTASRGNLELVTEKADASGNLAGEIHFGATAQTAGKRNIALISATTDGPTATQRGGYLIFQTAPDGGTLTERLRIDRNGNVGIGTTTPLGLMHIASTNPYYTLEETDQVAGQRMWVIQSVNGILKFGAGTDNLSGATYGLHLDRNGNVGIGTTSPTQRLHVEGGNLFVNKTGATLLTGYQTMISAGTDSALRIDSSNVDAVSVTNGGSTLFRINGSTGNVGIGTSTGLWAKTTIDGGGSTSATAALSIINNASTSLLFVRNDGNVGIGTTSPTQVLSVQGNILTSGCLKVKGAADTGTCVDLAESYPTSESVEAGDIVMLDSVSPVHIKKAIVATTTNNLIVGIVSTNPSILLNGDSTLFGGSTPLPFDSLTAPVALSGRVPVKVSLENGPIAIGDRISASSVAGVGKKAASTEVTVGIALESYDGTTPSSTGVSKILVFVNLGQPQLAAAKGTGDLASMVTANSDLNMNGFSLLNVKSIAGMNGLWRIDEGGNITAQSVQTQSLTIGGGAASGVTVYDRTTAAPKCIYIEGGVIKTSDGACGSTALTTGGPAAVIETASAPAGSPTSPASAPEVGLPSAIIATSTEPILTATTTPTVATSAEPVIVSTTTTPTAPALIATTTPIIAPAPKPVIVSTTTVLTATTTP